MESNREKSNTAIAKSKIWAKNNSHFGGTNNISLNV